MPEHVEGPLILGLDIGTSSVRALLFDGVGRAVPSVMARRSYELHTTMEGAAEADPDELLDCTWACIDELLDRAGFLSEGISGVAACTFVSNVLGVDAAGRAVTPLMTYADTRSADQADQLRQQLDELAVHQRTGCLFHSSYLPAQLRWLAHTRPEVFEDAVRWMSIGEYMEGRLFPTGHGNRRETAVSYSVASWTGLLNRRTLAWDGPLLEVLPIDVEQLSALVDVDEPRRGLRHPFAGRWPALRDVPWFPAVGDGAAANIGSGCVTPDTVALTMGSTTAVRIVTADKVGYVPRGLFCYRVDRQRSLPGGALSEGGNVFAWMRKTLGMSDRRNLDASLAGMEPDGHGLTILPFLAGERSPGWAGDARATVHGLTLATTPLDILRAAMEAVAYRIAAVFERLGPLLPDDLQIVASGGALLSSPVWLQIVADVLGQPVVPSRVGEASARGAALLALEALGALGDLREVPPPVGELVAPDRGRHAKYRRAMERQTALYETLVGQPDRDRG